MYLCLVVVVAVRNMPGCRRHSLVLALCLACVIAVSKQQKRDVLLSQELSYIGHRILPSFLDGVYGCIPSQTWCASLCLLQRCSFLAYSTKNQACEISSFKWLATYKTVDTSWRIFARTDTWKLAFKGNSANNISVYDLWAGSTFTAQPGAEVFKMVPSVEHYKSHLVENWDNFGVYQVKFAFFKEEVEVFTMEFEGKSSTKLDWFSQGRLTNSPFIDLIDNSIFKILDSDNTTNRRFFINTVYWSCDTDTGWVAVIDGEGVCDWEKRVSNYPQFWYSKTPTKIKWNSALGGPELGTADVMAIFVKYK